MAKVAQLSKTRAIRSSANYKKRSRVRIAKMVRSGRGAKTFNEAATLLGIDLSREQRPRLLNVCGHKVG
jgi:hypothetical protein